MFQYIAHFQKQSENMLLFSATKHDSNDCEILLNLRNSNVASFRDWENPNFDL